MNIIVITRVGDPTGGGNLALPADLYIQTETPDESNDFVGRHELAAKYIGPAYLALREPVFALGEILVLDENDRDSRGRKPGKWDVDVEEFDTIEAAYKRSREVAAG